MYAKKAPEVWDGGRKGKGLRPVVGLASAKIISIFAPDDAKKGGGERTLALDFDCLIDLAKKWVSRLVDRWVKNAKTYNSRYSLVVTHPTTNLPAHGLSTAERTGSPVFHVLWSIARVEGFDVYISPSLDHATLFAFNVLCSALCPGLYPRMPGKTRNCESGLNTG